MLATMKIALFRHRPLLIESGPVARERVGLDAFKLLQRITLGPDWLAYFAAKRVALFNKRGQADSSHLS